MAEQTRSNAASSLLILLSVAPAVVLGVVGGVVADRVDRKGIVVATNALRAAAMALFLALSQDVTAAFVTIVLVQTITVFFVPAEGAIIPSIVRREHLLVANSLFTFTYNGAFLGGFVILAPVMLTVAGYEVLFILLAAMFAAAALLCVTLPPSPPIRTLGTGAEAGHAVSETRRGFASAIASVREVPGLIWSLANVAIANTLIAVAGALAPGYVREVLGFGERSVALLVAPAGAGVVAGIVLLNVIGGRIARTRLISLAFTILGSALIGLAIARPLAEVIRGAAHVSGALPVLVAFLVVLTALIGAAYSFIFVPSMTTLQEELREDVRGRVFGVLTTIISGLSLLPLVVAGPVADRWGVAPVFASAAVLVWAAGLARARWRAPAM